MLETIEKGQLTEHATKLGALTMEKIRGFKNAGAKIKDVRGKGLFIGVELTAADGSPVVQAALARGLVINATHKNVLRICPALTITEQTMLQALGILEEALGAV